MLYSLSLSLLSGWIKHFRIDRDHTDGLVFVCVGNSSVLLSSTILYIYIYIQSYVCMHECKYLNKKSKGKERADGQQESKKRVQKDWTDDEDECMWQAWDIYFVWDEKEENVESFHHS